MKTHVRVGWALFWIFACGSLINGVTVPMRYPDTDILALWVVKTNFFWMIPLSVVYLLSTKLERLRFTHPVSAISYGFVCCIADTTPLMGIFYFAIGVGLLFRYGYLEKHFLWKSVPLALGIVVSIPASAIAKGRPFDGEMTDLTVVPLAFFVAVTVIFWDHIKVYIAPPPPRRLLDLDKTDLSELEKDIIEGMLQRHTPKEIHADLRAQGFKQSESTVYKARTSAMHKLGFQTPEDFLLSAGNTDFLRKGRHLE